MRNRIPSRYSPDAKAFLSLFAGLPSGERERQWVLIIQGYFDDSGSEPSDPLYVLAGFLAPVENWLAFADDWRACLSREPSLEALHTKDAYARDGEFKSGWNDRLIKQRLLEFAEVIKAHAAIRVHVCLLRKDFDAFVKGISPVEVHNDPYFLCYYKLLGMIAHSHLDVDGDNETLFDEQGPIGTQANSWWDFLVENYPPEMFSKFQRPLFRKDNRVLQLQAADMYAWHFHANAVGNMLGRKKHDTLHLDKILSSIPLISAVIERDELLMIGCGQLATRNALDREMAARGL